jgi:phosphoenolpyruvate-protein kinase (PTS system EI component)
MSKEGNSLGPWGEYGRLFISELERLSGAQEKTDKNIAKLITKIELIAQEVDQHRQVDEKTFEELAQDIKDIRDELIGHVKEVNEVWSPKQMQQVKNEVYRQKNQMAKWAGFIIAVQVLVGFLVAFGKEIFQALFR